MSDHKRQRSVCDGCMENPCDCSTVVEKEMPASPSPDHDMIMSEEPSAFCCVCNEEMDIGSQVCGPCVRNGPLMEWSGYVRRCDLPVDTKTIEDESAKEQIECDLFDEFK